MTEESETFAVARPMDGKDGAYLYKPEGVAKFEDSPSEHLERFAKANTGIGFFRGNEKRETDEIIRSYKTEEAIIANTANDVLFGRGLRRKR